MPQEGHMALLEALTIRKQFGTLRALDCVDLTVEQNQIHGLIGPNGSGKSTLLKCIAGAEQPTDGCIRFDGTDITLASPPTRARAGLSIKFQITSVLPALSVFDNVLLALQARDRLWDLVLSRTRRRLVDRVVALLSDFRLLARADAVAGTLSHGEQQWLEIAMALASEPRLLLLDEPTAGMSLEERRLTGSLLRPLRDRCSIVIVEHDLDFIRDICDELTVLDQGKVLETGTVVDIQASPKVKEVYLTRV
jgi:branched-chain amino acid transport system ATP-binding protein